MKDKKIAVIGLGYVGLPLAVAFGKQFPTVGFDISTVRIRELAHGHDWTREVTAEQLNSSKHLTFSDSIEDIADADIYIVAVPTPIDESKRPDLKALRAASRTVGSVLRPGNLVVYESTVYPGCTEEVCIPILAKVSGLVPDWDFHIGYSPERMNPGDRDHRLENVIKVVSGTTPEAAEMVADLYGHVVEVGVFMASSVMVAEAAKVIENTQRDLNIALVNELAIIFGKMQLDTWEVLRAAGTKWNFHSYKPGLVGGHCIGVDPYYLTYKAQLLGIQPEVILAGRRVNDGMGRHVAQSVVKLMISEGIQVNQSEVLILGATFKENCTDLRNTRVSDIADELNDFRCNVTVFDPEVEAVEIYRQLRIKSVPEPEFQKYDAAILAVAHSEFIDRGPGWIRQLLKPDGVIYDCKGVFHRTQVHGQL